MSKNNAVVPQAREALDKFKMEAARDVGVQFPLKENALKTIHFMTYIFKIMCQNPSFQQKRRAFDRFTTIYPSHLKW